MPPIHLLPRYTTLITGGTTGIGRAITLAFLRNGCNVAVNHLGLPQDAPHLSSLIAEAEKIRKDDPEAGRMIEVQGDVQDPETANVLVTRAVKEEGWSGRLDVCVSNAGVCRFEEFLGITPTLLTQTLTTNLSGAFYICQSASRQFFHQVSHPSLYSPSPSPSSGSIILISSISALVGGSQQCHYTPTKAGCYSLAQSMACALGKYGIRANALLPGTIETQLNAERLKVEGEEGERARIAGRIPLGTVGRPGDVAGPALFLACGELSGFVNGAGLLVDGGLFVNLQ